MYKYISRCVCNFYMMCIYGSFSFVALETAEKVWAF